MREQGADPERTHMSAGAPEATENDNTRRTIPRARLTVGSLRLLLTAVGVLGVLLAVLSVFSTVIEIKVLTTSKLATDLDTTVTGWERHSFALVLIALFGLVMLAGAVLRGARPAIVAIAIAGATILAISYFSDARHIHDTGQVGELYEDAGADAGSGFYLETLGGALLLIAGGGLLLVAGVPSEPEPTRPARREDDDEDVEPEPSDEPDGNWFE